MRINLYAGSCAGKSASAAKIYAELKARGHNVELVREYIKDWAYQGRAVKGLDQVFICASQLHAEEFLLQHGVEHLVTDSPLLLQCFYAWKYQCPVWEQLVGIAKYFDSKYPAMNIFLDRTGVPFKQSGRYEDEAGALDNDRKMMEFLVWMEVSPRIVRTVDSHDIVALFEEALLDRSTT